MLAVCRTCRRSNPTDAQYCYYDGICLQGSRKTASLDLSKFPFSQPFKFPSGHSCSNFDQLALACHAYWEEARRLLHAGVLEKFLAKQGRQDLAHAARQGATQVDPDQGLDYLLSRLPQRNLSEPSLKVQPTKMALGDLARGTQTGFELQLSNQGHRLIIGSVQTDCPWLQVDGTAPDQLRLVQFPDAASVRIHVLGDKLSAGQKPLEAQVIVSTNAGTRTIPVSCRVPVLPFPAGILAGCQTPRELVQRTQQRPQEAAALFDAGTVREWYRCNGWTFPIDGTQAAGLAAVQQFFEALGLARPPHILLDTPALVFKGIPGKRLRELLLMHTEENRALFIAAATCSSPWLTIVEIFAHGSQASVAVEATIPPAAPAEVATEVRITANGNQQFRVPVTLQVVLEPAPAPFPWHRPKQSAGSVLARWMVGCLVLGALLLILWLVLEALLLIAVRTALWFFP